ncbi:MAG TPA: SCE4755 family polysaccharide monooxygenase-like protein [Polyangia bacterium]|nr:SCE4755 family polysaccharide monooxygenase-like protein [Polyangia bacterium]
MRTLVLTSTIALLSFGSTAQAHFVLMSPPPTNPGDATQGKGAPPCGPDTAAAASPMAAQGGHTIMLKLQETVRHGGFYRVAMSINARSEIPVDNVVYDAANKILPPSGNPQGTSDHADTEATPVFPVLGDNLFPHPQAGAGNQIYQMALMLPNVTCAKCTLQVIEFMAPHGFNPGGGYFYHHCADLKITADPAMPPFSPGADGGAADASADGKPDSGAAGNTGAAGSGVAGSMGSAGAAGSGSAGATGSGGEAGATVATGAGGSTGSAGSSTAGVTGTGSGAAGTGAPRSSGGSGCSLAGASGNALGCGLVALMLLGGLFRRRERPEKV